MTQTCLTGIKWCQNDNKIPKWPENAENGPKHSKNDPKNVKKMPKWCFKPERWPRLQLTLKFQNNQKTSK